MIAPTTMHPDLILDSLNGSPPLGVILYVVGDAGLDPNRNPILRTFPPLNREEGETEAAHLRRVVDLVEEAIRAGGTHLLVPREQADWLGDHPRVAEYFAEQHELAEASAETGITFKLHLRNVDRVHVTGYFGPEMGLGVAARGYLRALDHLGIPIALHDLTHHIVSGSDQTTIANKNFNANRRFDVSLICVNAREHYQVVQELGEEHFLNHYTIGVWYWELPRFPAEWHDRFAYYDEIWVGSSFIANALAPVSPIPVVRIPPVMEPVGEGSRANGRRQLRVADDEFVFLFIFSFHSVFERKNPLAVIKAFKRAFSPDDRVRLVIKCVNEQYSPADFAQMKALAKKHRISIHSGYWEPDQMRDLMPACDAYVSLHRSEGIGLTMADAMAQGKPVIATDWSGNTDFMDVTNSFPVRYELVTLERDFVPYRAGETWAEPSVEHAADLMRRVFEERDEETERGLAAKAVIQSNFSTESVARLMHERLAVIGRQLNERRSQDKFELMKLPVHHSRGAIQEHKPMEEVILYIVGGADSLRKSAARNFPLINREQGESETAHLELVVHVVDEAMAAGGTHLLVPREQADWLGDHPLIAEYFAAHHELAEAHAETGIIFRLRRPESILFSVQVDGWEIVPSDGIALVARQQLTEPKLTLRPTEPATGLLRGQLVFAADGLRTLRLDVALRRDGRRLAHGHELVLSLTRPGFLFHELAFAQVSFHPDGTVLLEFDLALDAETELDGIWLKPVEEDNWRVHPTFGGGASFTLPATVPTGAWLEVREVSMTPAAMVRTGPPHGTVQGRRPAPYRKPAGRPRDAVIFSSWVPEAGLALGDYFIELLHRYHADSRIFVGVNRGSSPAWSERLLASGLDLTIAPVPPRLSLPVDPSGFVAALDAYSRHEESFDLIWFGQTTGMGHRADPRYATARWTIERMYWSRRQEIERYFDNSTIGLYAPHYLMMTQSHLQRIDALQRMYPGKQKPLGAAALSSHFVLRDASVRDFCAQVDARFFQEGPQPFGGDEYFFEMGLPNLATMQGHEPFIEPGLGGTSGAPAGEGASLQNDWRQNHAVVSRELEKWRQDPAGFRTEHQEHRYVFDAIAH